MPAHIKVTLHSSYGGPVVGVPTFDQSRDDLRKGYWVVVESVDAATSYQWSLSFTPQSPGSTGVDPYAGTPSAAALLAPPAPPDQNPSANFMVDWDGSYLVKLITDVGVPGVEDTQYVRLRVLTKFGKIKLVAAGERRDTTGIIPVDVSIEGWANDQNQNLQRLMTFSRRLSTSGRTLYVDANRGRNNAASQNNPNNLVHMPGPDPANIEESGIRIGAEGFGDFSSINAAITYAAAAAGRGEPAPSAANPYWIIVRPGNYPGAITYAPYIYVCSDYTGWADYQQVTGPGTFIVEAMTRLVGVDCSGGPVILLLPGTLTLPSGQAIAVKDESGTSSLNSITVRPNPPNPPFPAPIATPIDGTRESVIDLNRMALMYYTDGASWFVV